jgi:uncharacterized protein YeaO (DUF488 family)
LTTGFSGYRSSIFKGMPLIFTAEMSNELRIKRAYEPPSKKDGLRYLVDRLWPRGLKKEDLALDGWLKDVAPSQTLRKWFGHDPEKWDEFRSRYRAELRTNQEALKPLLGAMAKGPVTLVYSARDEAHNQAVVLREFLVEQSTIFQKRSTHTQPEK